MIFLMVSKNSVCLTWSSDSICQNSIIETIENTIQRLENRLLEDLLRGLLVAINIRKSEGFHFSLGIFILSINNINRWMILDFDNIWKISDIIEFSIESICLRW